MPATACTADTTGCEIASFSLGRIIDDRFELVSDLSNVDVAGFGDNKAGVSPPAPKDDTLGFLL